MTKRIRFMENEKWVDVVGYEDEYEISDYGRIRTKNRIINYISKRYTKSRNNTYKSISLRPYKTKKDRLRVCLCKNSKTKKYFIHRLVLEAFVGPCPEGMECCHNNGDPSDNKLENLRWDSKTENAKDRIKHGTHRQGEKINTAKIKGDEVWLIKKLIHNNICSEKIMKIFKISSSIYYKIKNRVTWKHIIYECEVT